MRADDEPDIGFLGGDVRADDAGERAFVGDGDREIAKLLGAQN